MIFAEKVTKLRKKNGWSQEELAEQMQVSRQAVSKWESAQAVPDLQKLLALSRLFGVTVDYLLKDELETEEFTETADYTVRRVSLSEANCYLEYRQVAAKRIALATVLCILSPVALLLFGVSVFMGVSEDFAAIAGLGVLFLMVAAAVAIYLYTGFQNAPYGYLDKEPFELDYGVQGMVQERKKAFSGTYIKGNIAATVLCILSPVPLIIGSFSGKDLLIVVLVCLLLLLVAAAVAVFILLGVRWASFQRLLREGEFSDSGKKKAQLSETVSTVYWLVIVAVYLAVSFATDWWGRTWIIWPVAALLSGVVDIVCKSITSNGKDS